MRITNNSIDIKFSDDMDFIIDKDTSDLKKAYEFNGEVSTQMIIKRCFSDIGDWQMHPFTGAGLNKFEGLNFNRDLSGLIKTTIIDELTREFLFNSRNIDVKVIPLTKSSLKIVVAAQNNYMKKPVIVTSGLSLDSYVSRQTSPIL